MKRRTIDRLIQAATLAVLLAALYVLYRNFREVRLAEILDPLEALPAVRLVATVALTAASYLLLTGYDFLALRYVRCRLRVRDVLFASLTAFAFSNSVGFALVSGGSVRYRIYSGLGLSAAQIAEIVVYCTVTYALGFAVVGGLILVIDPPTVASLLDIPQYLVRGTGIAMLGVGVLYLAIISLRRRPIPVGSYRLRLPSLGEGVLQIVLASLDLALAGAVIFALLPPQADIDYPVFLGIYVTAAAASVLSLVPGGIGVFEAVLVLMLANASGAISLGTLILYRVVYFLLPLGMAAAALAIYEIRRTPRELGWLGRLARGRDRSRT